MRWMHKHPPSAHIPVPPSKPFLRWPGGKGRLLPQLLPLLPSGRRLIEPFVGAGSVFLAANYQSYVINDANPDLVAMWVALQAQPGKYMERANSFIVEENRTPQAYVELRKRFNEEVDSFERAALLLYLNKFAFNGIYRVNSRGKFNVPFGDPKKMPRFPWEEIEAASRRLEQCLILNGGFRGAIDLAGEGDVVYCDPPYVSTDRPSFIGYTAAGFGMEQQRDLVAACEEAVSRGAIAVISNHDTATTRELYSGWDIHQVSVRRSVAAEGSARRFAQELVATLKPNSASSA